MIYVCSIEEMPEQVRALRPGYLVSMVEEEAQPPRPREIAAERHLRLAIDDITEPRDGCTLPGDAEVGALIGFLRARDRELPILLHCVAGISRSMAGALIALALDAEGREEEAALRLRAAAPHAQPNARIVAVADRLLGREGRLVAALHAMGPADLEAIGRPVALSRLV